MAEEVVDSVLLAARFDDQGLDRSSQAVLAAVDRVTAATAKASNTGDVAAQAMSELAKRSLEAAAGFRAAGVAEEHLNAALERSGLLAVQVAREMQAASQAVAAAATGGATTPAGGAQPRIIRDKVADLRLLAGQLQQLPPIEDAAAQGAVRMAAGFDAAAIGALRASRAAHEAAEGAAAWARGTANIRAANDALATSLQTRITTGFNQAGEAGRRASEGNAAMARGIALASGTLLSGGRALDTHGQSASRAARTLGILAAQSVGAQGPVGRLAEVALFASGGLGLLAGVAVGAIVAAKAWEIFTKEQREAAAATEDNRKALKALQEQQKGPVKRAQESFDSQVKEVGRLKQALDDVAAARKVALADIGRPTGDPFIEKMATINALTKEQTSLTKDLAAAQGELGAARKAVTDAGFELIVSQAREMAVLSGSEDAVRRLEIANSGLSKEIIAGALAQHDQIVALRRQKEAAEEAAKALEKVLETQKAIRVTQAGGGNLTPGAGGTPIPLPSIPTILQGARAQGLESGEGDAIKKAAADMKEFARAAQEALDASPFAQYVEDARELGTELPQVLTSAEKLSAAFSKAGQAVSDLGRIGDSLGIINEEALAALGSIQDMLAAAASGNVLGVIAGALEFGQAAFGKDATQLEHARIQEQNIAALERNTAAIEAATTPGGLAAAGATIDKALGTGAAGIFRLSETFDPTGGKLGAAALDAALRETGSSLKELDAIARANGIELLDSKGRLVAGALDVLDAALEKAAEEARKFGTSLSDRQSILETEDKLGLGGRSEDERVARIQRTRELQLGAAADPTGAGLHLSPEEEARVRGLDLETVEGREAFLEWERDLFKRAKAQGLTAEELNDFTAQGLLGPIGDAADSINELDDASAKAAKSLSDFNLPSGFRRAALAFAAGSTGSGLPEAGGQALAPDPWHPPRVRGSDGAALPVAPVFTGSVTVHVDGSKDPQATADAVIEALRRLGHTQTGDTTAFGPL